MVSEITVNNYNTGEVCDSSEIEVYPNADAPTYFKNLSLSHFAANPFEMLTKHAKLKELCLEHGNPEAHYIEGVLKYFVHQERKDGLFHLRESAVGDNKEGTYLYGLLMLARGSYITGKRYLDKLGWRESIATSDQCWARIQISLEEIHISWKRRYNDNMANLAPQGNCDRNDNNELCNNCYYYKRLKIFYKFVTDKE